MLIDKINIIIKKIIKNKVVEVLIKAKINKIENTNNKSILMK